MAFPALDAISHDYPLAAEHARPCGFVDERGFLTSSVQHATVGADVPSGLQPVIGKHAATTPGLALKQAQRSATAGEDRRRVGEFLRLRHFANLLHHDPVWIHLFVLKIERVFLAVNSVARELGYDFLQ